MKTKIIIAYVHDRPGVLTKIASIFYRRDMNIRTLTVGQTAAFEVSKLVFRVSGSEEELNRLALCIDNLVDVVSVQIIEDTGRTARELCLARVAYGKNHSLDALRAGVARYSARIWQQNEQTVVLEVVDAPEQIDSFIATLAEYDLIDLSRTGATAAPGAEPVQGAIQHDADNITCLVQHMHRF